MPSVARVGDTHNHGGNIITGSPNVFANNLGVARIGDRVFCIKHGIQSIASGSRTVIANGAGVARVGDRTTCGAVITSGSPNVFAGG